MVSRDVDGSAETTTGDRSEIYQQQERAIASLVAVIAAGLAGDASGARQLLQRHLRGRRSRTELDVERLRSELSHTLAATKTPYQPLRLGDPTSAWDTGPAEARPVRRGRPSEPSGLLRVDDSATMDLPVLDEEAWADISQVLAEHRRYSAGTLGLEPTRTLLLTGPPGTGKTMTARYVASALSLPLLTLNLASIVEAELGRTGANVRDALAEARQLGGVLFLDELDALAAQRGLVGEVGEARRIVNVLLLELDSWPAGHLLIAATNHPDLLDQAIWRRFDVKVNLGLPDGAGRHRVLTKAIADQPTRPEVRPVTVDAIAQAAIGASPADLVSLVQRAARRSVIREEDFDIVLLEEALRDGDTSAVTTDVLAALLADEGNSYREIARRLNISHPTASKKVARGLAHLASGGSNDGNDETAASRTR